ncbi:MAG TPA: response regulator [Gemmataceae bacterium]|nr:response regulator [Gemmataceae bacterium]
MASTWSPPEQRIRSSRPDGRVLHVLVVEDDADCAECLAFLLHLGGVAVEIAADGSDALASIQASLPDVVLMDIGLPDMDGYQLARSLRAVATKMPLLIALSGYLEDNDPQRPREEGFDYHFVKPIDPVALLALLDDYAKSQSETIRVSDA